MYFIIIILIFSTFLLLRYKKSSRNLPPGPIRWPILGSIPQMSMIDPKYPHIQLMELTKKYGEIFSVGLGIHYGVVVSSFELISEIFKRPEATMERFKFQFLDQRSEGKNLGIIWGSGETWVELRKFTIRKLTENGFVRVSKLETNINDEIKFFINQIQNEKNGTWEVEATSLAIFTLNVIWSSVGNYRFDPNDPILQSQIQINDEVVKILETTNLLAVLPFLKVFPNWSGYKKHGEIHEKCRKFTRYEPCNVKQELIVDAKKRRNGRIEPESFLEHFLDEIEKHRTENSPSIYTEEQLILILMDLFLAGSETISTVIRWLTLYFAIYPNIQEKAREEIFRVSENGNRHISISEIKKLPYVKACILETFRHSPFLSAPSPRKAVQDIHVNGYTIPKGTVLQMLLYSVFHDKEYWGDEDVFRPERFFNEDGLTLNKEKVARIIQFGVGRRVCPAEDISYKVISSMFINLLGSYEIKPIAGKKLELKPSEGVTTPPVPFTVQLKPLMPSNELIF